MEVWKILRNTINDKRMKAVKSNMYGQVAGGMAAMYRKKFNRR